ncbi:MAG: hypothetical protein HLUCCA04_08070 [Oceanicaulis sp. HLUCCA04]|nr:MAG: hypothetical protein HLUCCA04_08070 [Oceanicaulis sp. HLUCCA04]
MTNIARYPNGTVKPSNTDTYEHATNGLLTKRADLFNEGNRIRDRLAEIRNDIAALDRTLATLGFKGDLNAMMPRRAREVMFAKGELADAVMQELRHAEGPLRSRQIAAEIVALRGDDARDQKYVTDLTRRVSKVLRIMRINGEVKCVQDQRGNYMWVQA